MVRNFILVVFMSFFAVGAFAAIPTDLDTQKWHDLLEQIQLTGKASQYPNGVYLSASHVVPNDLDQPHVANYISTVGRFDNDGNYRVGHIEGVSEVATRDQDGNMHVDQWLFVADVDADLRSSYHRHIVKTAEGIVTKLETLPTTEKERMEQWDRILKEWFQRMPLSL